MKEAQNTYLLPYDQPSPTVASPLGSDASESRKRYRTSANDRERRVAARSGRSYIRFQVVMEVLLNFFSCLSALHFGEHLFT